MKKIISSALAVCLLCSITASAKAATNTTYASTPSAKGTGSITISSKSATAKTSATADSNAQINGVSVTATFEYGVGNEIETVSKQDGVDGDSKSVTVTAPYTYVTAISATGDHYYAAYNRKTGEGESASWSSYITP